jgi:hypothetical protein
MQFSRLLFATALVTLGAAGAAFALHQSPDDTAKMVAFATPGENHKLLDYKVGKWNGHVTMWMAPGAPAMESESTSETKWIMGGRYLHDDVHGTFGGQPFEGLGISGYDNLKKKFVYSWVDNLGTGIMSGEGTYDAAKKVLTSMSTMSDPASGKVTSSRGTETRTDDNTWKMEMFASGPDGKEFLTMRIEYKRAK